MRKAMLVLALTMLSITGVVPVGASHHGDVRPEETVASPQQQYELVHQDDGNVVLYDANKTAVWHTQTNGTDTSRFTMQGDGNLVLYNAANEPVWHTGTNGKDGAHLAVQDDGNLVIYHGDKVVWAIKHWPPPPPKFEYNCVKADYPYNYGWTLDDFRPEDRATACRVMLCESHVDPARDPATITNMEGSSASGLFQFLDSTWKSVAKYYAEAGRYARAMYAPVAVQAKAAAIWLSVTSWSQWACY